MLSFVQILMQTILLRHFVKKNLLAGIFYSDANKRVWFCYWRISNFYINSKNEDDLTSASYFTDMNTF